MEILVVIAIIAILAGISIAGFRAALISSKRAKCAANLHAIGVAMLAFAGDNNQNLPESGAVIPHGQTDSPPPAGSGLPSWTEQLEPYLGKSSDSASLRVYQCPDTSTRFSDEAQYSYFNGSHGAYTPNDTTGAFHAVNLLRIHSISAYIMAGDIAANGLFGAEPDADKDNYSIDVFKGATAANPVSIHGGLSNLVFADGHVEAVKYFDPTQITTSYPGPGATYTILWTP